MSSISGSGRSKVLKTIAAFKDVVDNFNVELFEREGKRSRLKARITFIDGSVLVIKDYSHHKHVGSPGNVEPSLEIELRDVLKVIRSRIMVQRL